MSGTEHLLISEYMYSAQEHPPTKVSTLVAPWQRRWMGGLRGVGSVGKL